MQYAQMNMLAFLMNEDWNLISGTLETQSRQLAFFLSQGKKTD